MCERTSEREREKWERFNSGIDDDDKMWLMFKPIDMNASSEKCV